MADQGRRAETKTDDFEQLRELNNHAARQEARNTDVPVTQRRGRNLNQKYLNSNDLRTNDPVNAQVRHVVHAQGLRLPPPAQAAEEGPRAQNQ